MVTIRPFQSEDLDQCADLYVRVFAESPWSEEWAVEEARRHLERSTQTPGFLGLVAMDGERIVGVVTSTCRSHAAGNFAMLDDMFVDHMLRSQGIGLQLLDEMKQRLKAQGCIAVGLFTQATSRAADFYRKHGFQEEPNLRFMLLGLD